MGLAAGVALLLTSSRLEAQAMTGGGNLRGGREAIVERLSRLSPDLVAHIHRLRDALLGSGGTQRLEWGATLSRVASGDEDFSEWASPFNYELFRSSAALRLTGGPVHFTGDTASLSGLAPFAVRLDLALSDQDSLGLAARTSSFPSSLTREEVIALATVGTSVVDLASVQLGTPAMFGVRYAHLEPLTRSLVVALEVGGELEPRPADREWVLWKGTTLRFQAGIGDVVGPTYSGVRAEVTRSYADSLEGRNLFSGGGTVLIRAYGAREMSGDVLAGVSSSYFHPFSTLDRTASGRRLPLGDFAGLGAVVAFPMGKTLVVPSAVFSLEWSEISSDLARADGLGWAVSPSLYVDVRLPIGLVVTPEAGYTVGNVSLEVLTTLRQPSGPPIVRTTQTADGLAGWWFSARLSMSW